MAYTSGTECLAAMFFWYPLLALRSNGCMSMQCICTSIPGGCSVGGLWGELDAGQGPWILCGFVSAKSEQTAVGWTNYYYPSRFITHEIIKACVGCCSRTCRGRTMRKVPSDCSIYNNQDMFAVTLSETSNTRLIDQGRILHKVD